jgi:glycosyltransferase involved in cell wall biosynthesis
MASGCPCVVQDLPVLREVTAGAARLVDFTDTTAAGAALASVCRDDDMAERLRAAGVRRAREFSFERLARERMEAILQVLGAKR